MFIKLLMTSYNTAIKLPHIYIKTNKQQHISTTARKAAYTKHAFILVDSQTVINKRIMNISNHQLQKYIN